MNCLPCFQNDDDEDEGNDNNNNNNNNQPTPTKADTQAQTEAAKEAASSSNAKAFTFRELAMATKNFRQECLLGEGGFGRVFKGKLHSTGQVVAVKQLDRNNMQGNNEFMVEILMLSLLQHPNLVSLIGYCADGDQRLLVYEYLEMGNLERHLFGDDNPEKQPMDWYTRMKIAAGAAQGLEYLHEKANPPIIYRDLKPSNILLDDNYEPKLSDCGLAKLGGGGGTMNPASRVMGTYGYSAPEYSSSGELTLKSDMYSFGVVLLELITGRRVIDTTRPNDEQNLITWAQPIFREPKRFPDLADPRLNNEFPVTSLNQAVGICAMCLQEEPSVRPLVGDVVAALSFLGVPQPNATHFSAQAGKDASPSTFSPPPEQKMHYGDDDANQGPVSQPDNNKSNQDRNSDSDDNKSNHEDSSSSDESDNEGGDNEGGDRESVSEQQNTGVQSSVGDESGRLSERQNSDDSEEEGTYSGSGSGDESSNYDDAENTEFDNSETTNPSEGGSSKSDAGNLSSKHGSSRRSSSPTKRTGSRRRKMVVTFKEPSKSSIRSTSKKEKQEENNSENQPVTPEDGQQKSSSESSSSSSDSEDDEQQKFARHQKGQKRREASSSMDDNEQRVLDGVHEDGPKLQHLQTR